MSDLVRLCDIVISLLVLHEREPNVQGADVEDEGDGDVEETQQHHQLTGPVEKVEVDGRVWRHLRGSVGFGSVYWGRKRPVAPGSNRLLAAALRLHFEEVGSESFVLFSLVNDGVEASSAEPGQQNTECGAAGARGAAGNLRLHQLSARTLTLTSPETTDGSGK